MPPPLKENTDDARLLPPVSQPSDKCSFPMIGQAAELLSMSRETLEAHIRNGEVRAIQAHRGAKRRIIPTSCREWAAQFSSVEYEWEEVSGRPVAILRASGLFRATSVVTEPCAFCGQQHLHGSHGKRGNWRYTGPRTAHCCSYVGDNALAEPIRIFARDGTQLSMASGYILRPQLIAAD